MKFDKINNKMKILKKIFLIASFAIMTNLLLTTCSPPKTPKLIVTCVDSLGTPVIGALVTITTTGASGGVTRKGIVTDQGSSGSDGTIKFEFKLPLVASVRAAKAITSPDSLVGKNSQFCDWDKTSTLTVKMRRK